MDVTRKLLYSFIIGVAATVLSVTYFPGVEFSSYASNVIGLGVVATIALASISFYREDDLTMHDKNMLMNGFLIAILVPSFYTAGAFIHQSQISWSGGEIHYHADYEVIVEKQGELKTLDLINPEKFCAETKDAGYMCKLNDRTGVTKYHEHNDNRIHLEGIFETKEQATLSAYFETFGGKLSNTELVYPTNSGTFRANGNGKTLKVVVNRGTGGNRHWCVVGTGVPESEICENPYTGEKATSPSKYIVSPYKKGPSLDDIFIIYDSNSVQTALRDLRQDGKYKGMGLSKEGEGF